ncbi:hypothetical protein L6232_21480, partial [Shewanella sp. C31]|nr:hypothetical protein [Shewanella electrica]
AETDALVLDALGILYPGAKIRPADPELDALGVDLVVDNRPFPVGVQVKRASVDLYPLKTARIILEDFADVRREVPGWLWTTRAELLVVRYEDGALVLHFPTLRAIADLKAEKWAPYRRTNVSTNGRRR